MKLIIQIPCLNEAEQLPDTLADLPRSVEGFDVVEWLIIDDGSTDSTVEVARGHGVDHVVTLPQNRGLANAFSAGLDASLKLGADVIVNTDADNQYRADDIASLVEPILDRRADIVIGARDIADHPEFSWLKIKLQQFGSWVVRQASGTDVPDATSGFRAYSQEAALGLNIVTRYTYTIESIIAAGRINAAVISVPIRTNPKVRESRLFGSMFGYVRRNSLTILRVFAAYEPLTFFGVLSFLLFAASGLALTPFFIDWIANGDRSGHLQSLLLGGVLFVASLQMGALAIVADLIAGQRVTASRTLERVKRLELSARVEPTNYDPDIEGDRRTTLTGPEIQV